MTIVFSDSGYRYQNKSFTVPNSKICFGLHETLRVTNLRVLISNITKCSQNSSEKIPK